MRGRGAECTFQNAFTSTNKSFLTLCFPTACRHFCQVQFDLDEPTVKVATKDLHALDPPPNGKYVAPSDIVHHVDVGGVIKWLAEYQDKKMVDLVLRKVNDGCSKDEFHNGLLLAQQRAVAGEGVDDMEAANVLARLGGIDAD